MAEEGRLSSSEHQVFVGMGILEMYQRTWGVSKEVNENLYTYAPFTAHAVSLEETKAVTI